MKNIFYINQVKRGEELTLDVDESIAWMQDILHELQEGFDEKDIKPQAPSISFNGIIKRKKDGKFGDYLLIQGKLKACFCTYCVKSGSPMLDSINVQVDSAILDDEIKTRLRDDDDTIFLDQHQLDLYYYQNNCFDMQKILHEYLFLNKNPYPSLIETKDSL